MLLLRHYADPYVKTKDGVGALDFALTGVSDVDKFTLFRCQDSTFRLLVRDHPNPRDHYGVIANVRARQALLVMRT